MQHPHSFRDSSVSIRSARLLAFASELPAEMRSVPDAKPDSKQLASPAESDARQAKCREQREISKRREAWERACEEMTDEQLLQTLGELHVKTEDTNDQRNFGARNSEHSQFLSRQIEFIEDQLEGARQVWIDRKHAKKPVAEWNKEVTDLATQLVTSREQFDQLSTTSRRYADERLKLAVLEEQNHLARAAGPLVKTNAK